ncbi:hypothetical protein ACFSCV_14430 [Methylopila henanensis]|uniref:CoxF protein n=2 Tax=Methylopila henanensis TaxID=873516 RepID=A0ABW4KAA5_9HYPH
MTEPEDRGVVLTPEQKRQRNRRNVALALALGSLVVIFWLVTVFKLGGAVLNRPL